MHDSPEVGPRFEQLSRTRSAIGSTRRSSIVDLGEGEVRACGPRRGTRQWIADHRETIRCLRHLDAELVVIDSALGRERDLIDGIERVVGRAQQSAANNFLDAVPAPMQRSGPVGKSLTSVSGSSQF